MTITMVMQLTLCAGLGLALFYLLGMGTTAACSGLCTVGIRLATSDAHAHRAESTTTSASIMPQAMHCRPWPAHRHHAHITVAVPVIDGIFATRTDALARAELCSRYQLALHLPHGVHSAVSQRTLHNGIMYGDTYGVITYRIVRCRDSRGRFAPGWHIETTGYRPWAGHSAGPIATVSRAMPAMHSRRQHNPSTHWA